MYTLHKNRPGGMGKIMGTFEEPKDNGQWGRIYEHNYFVEGKILGHHGEYTSLTLGSSPQPVRQKLSYLTLPLALTLTQLI